MPQILIVDDDDSIRRALRFRLKDSFEVIDTGSPEEALALALQHKPDAVLLDLMMPKYSGFEVCQALSSLSFTQHIPIVIVSGESAVRYRAFCESLGAKDFFQKPVDVVALKERLKKLIANNAQVSPSTPYIYLRVPLKLCWTDSAGASLELLTVTEKVSTNGFLCECEAPLEEGAIVDVYLGRERRFMGFMGKARAVRVDWPGTPGQKFNFRFEEKPEEWILR